MTGSQGKEPKWRLIAAGLEDDIRKGRKRPGLTLTPVKELAETEGMAVATASKIYNLLAGKGLVVSQPGGGTYVSYLLGKIVRAGTSRYVKAFRESSDSRGAFAAEIRARGMTPSSETSVSRQRPSEEVAEILGVSRRTPSVLVRARTMYANTTPVQIAVSSFPGSIAFDTALEEDDTGKGGSISRLGELGYVQTRMSEDIDVRPPTAAEARSLKIPRSRTVFQITHIGTTADGTNVEVCFHILPTHLWTLNYEWEIDTVAA